MDEYKHLNTILLINSIHLFLSYFATKSKNFFVKRIKRQKIDMYHLYVDNKDDKKHSHNYTCVFTERWLVLLT